ncbi:MAG: repeat protein [Chitinophagaceae bacterium]|nr:repeat protein [Chitinophagaceae bacterium]
MMIRLFLNLFCIVCFCNVHFCYSQSFQRLLGTKSNDSFSSMVRLSNGDYIVIGTTVRVGAGSDIYVARIDTSGFIIWENTYGGIGNEDNAVSCINNNGNIVIAASSLSYNGGRDLDIFLFEIDINGLVMWSRNYGKGANSSKSDEIPRKINLSSRGLILCATIGFPGSNSPDVLALEVRNNGQVINWQNQINIISDFGDIPSSIISSRGGGYIIAGGSFTTQNNYDQVIWRLNSTGSLTSNIAYGSNSSENAQDVLELSNNDIIVMGNFRGFSGNGLEFSLCSIRSNNTFNWIRTYGDNSSRDERAYGFTQTSNGYAFCGYTNKLNLNDILLVWTDNQGRILGNTSIGDSGKEESSAIVQNSDNSFTIAGVSSSDGAGLNDCYLVKTNKNGIVTNNCSSYNIVERTITASTRSYSYSESNPQLSNVSVSIARNSPSLDGNDLACSTLPLELLEFQVSFNGSGNSLTWISINEYDLSHFEIERSLDAKNWELIKLVKGEGSIGEKANYFYIDYEKNNVCLYYRLKQVDYNADYSYSKIIKICSSTNDVFIYPNPTKRFLSIKGLQLNYDGLVSVSIKNLNGIELLKESLNVNQIANKELVFDIDSLDLGVYILSLICDDETFCIRVIKE